MQKLTLTWVGEKSQIKTVKGMADKMSVKAQEYNDKFLSVFCNAYTDTWQVGMAVEVEKVEEVNKTGADGSLKTYYNIKFPSKEDRQGKANEDILSALTKLNLKVERLIAGLTDVHKAVVPPQKPKMTNGEDYPTPEAEGLNEEALATF